jgi:nucleoside-diphosphate-sugar epimerase
MNILIVGGAGYIGGAITDILQETNHKSRVYDSLIYEESYRKPFDFVFGDVRDIETLSGQLEWADAVIWLAALVGDGACAINPDISEEINKDSVKWLCENYDGRIIFTSTCSVYGAQNGILSEESPTGPLSVYARTKLAAERYLKDKDALIFRLGTLFGISDLFARLRLDLVVNVMTVRAALEGELTVYGGEQFRPLLHVRDVAEAIVQYIDTEHAGIYNLHRQNVRIVDLAYQVRNHFPDTIVSRTEMEFEDARNYRVSSDKIRSELGWRPKYSIDDGIIEIKELIETKRLKDVMNPRYTNQAFLTRCVPELQQFKVPVLNTKVAEHAR